MDASNTLQSGDVIDGGAGADTVYIDFLSAGNAVTPTFKNVESVVVRAQSAGTDANGVSAIDGNNMPIDRTVQIDAQRSLAVDSANKVTADLGVTNWDFNGVNGMGVPLFAKATAGGANLTVATNVTAGVTARIATAYSGVAATNANDVHVLTLTSTATDTFAGLTAAKLLAAVNTTGNVPFAGLVDGSLTAANGVSATALVGGIAHAVVLVQNDANSGEYAAFDLTFNAAAATGTDFTAAQLIGTVDFGATVTFATANLA